MTGASLFQIKCMVILAAVAMLLPIGMQYIGEEPFFALTTYGMLFSGDWSQATLYGWGVGRLPLFQWAAGMCAQIIGTQHMNLAIRLVSIMSSWLTAYAVGSLMLQLSGSRRTAWLAGLIFLTLAETMFWYGWLGYSDAMFSCFVFCSIALLWHALEKEHTSYYASAWFVLALAVMTKALTAYVFFGVAALVLITALHRWPFVMRPYMLLIALLGTLIPWGVAYLLGDFSGFLHIMVYDVTKHHGGNWMGAAGHVLAFPFITFLRTLPFSLLTVWLVWKQKRIPENKNLRMLMWIVALNYLPYWLNMTASPRYIIPLYPLVSMLFVLWLTEADDSIKRWAGYLLVIVLVIKVPFSFWILPYTKGGMRTDHNMSVIAEDIIRHARSKPILSENDAASGMGVAAYIDQQLFPGQIVLNPSAVHGEAYILTYFPKPQYGKLVDRYHMHGDTMYLYHRQAPAS